MIPDWNVDPRENSVGPLAEWLYETTYLSPQQAEKVARAILALVDDGED